MWDGELYLNTGARTPRRHGPSARTAPGGDRASQRGVALRAGRRADGRSRESCGRAGPRAGSASCSTSSTTSCPAPPSGRSTRTPRDYEHVTATAPARAIERGQRAMGPSASRPAARPLVKHPCWCSTRSRGRGTGWWYPRKQKGGPALSERARRSWFRAKMARWLVSVRGCACAGIRGLRRRYIHLPAAGHSGRRDHRHPTGVENRFHRVALNEHGQITLLVDKRSGREVLARGSRGNVPQVFGDMPMQHDAWDIDIYYGEKQVRKIVDLIESTVEETGPVRSLRLRWRSRRLDDHPAHHAPRGEPATTSARRSIGNEVQTLLKVAFLVGRARRRHYDIQFGSTGRPAHWKRLELGLGALSRSRRRSGSICPRATTAWRCSTTARRPISSDNAHAPHADQVRDQPGRDCDQGCATFTYSPAARGRSSAQGGMWCTRRAGRSTTCCPCRWIAGRSFCRGDRAGELSDRCSLAEVVPPAT